jgi:hypothetical protein
VNWLQTIANVWQRTADDNAHRVVEIASLHLELQINLLDIVVCCGYFFV